jgi:hypothetical protein
MSWIKEKANIILVAASCVVAICLFELISRYLVNQNDSNWVYLRYMLFSDRSGGKVFRNVKNFFIYEPNRVMHSQTYYFVNGNWVNEYDYLIPTNNLGLVQRNSTQSNFPSVLVLGDSYTEGQGASPWFEMFRKNFSQKYLQFVNGGIVGTGFQQWELLHDYLLTEGVIVKHLVVIFISDDYRRGIWNFSTGTFGCLVDYQRCVGNEDFYGIPNDKDRDVYLEKLRAYRERALNSSFNQRIEHYLPATTMIIRFLRDSLGSSEAGDSPRSQNRKVIASLIARYKDDILFVHIPQKDEVVNQRVDPLGYVTREDIKRLGGEFYDGQAHCNLTKEDFFVHDGHPNAIGYAKISACVTAAVKDKWSLQ